MTDGPKKHFPSAADDEELATLTIETGPSVAQMESDSYKLVYNDFEFLQREELRPLRLQLEYFKPELILKQNKIEDTVVIFGSARPRLNDIETAELKKKSTLAALAESPEDKTLQMELAKLDADIRHGHYYQQSRELAQLISRTQGCEGSPELYVVTGGGPGIMEAGNRGATDVGAKSVGLNIVLPHEQYPNAYITPELCFNFHYFAIRKMHLLVRAQALIVFPGGYGTLDELFEVLTLIQTGKIKPLPILIFGKEYWEKLINFQLMIDEGLIHEHDLDMFQYVDSAEQAWDIIEQNYNDQAAIEPLP